MNSIGIEQILPNEPGYTDIRKSADPAPIRIITPPRTPAEDLASMIKVAGVAENLLREVRRKGVAPERVVAIDRELRAKIQGILSQVVMCRRQRTGVVRSAADQFETVQAARRLYLSINPSSHEELITRSQQALEIFRVECQNVEATTKTS